MGPLLILTLLAVADLPTVAVFDIHDTRDPKVRLGEGPLGQLTTYMFTKLAEARVYRLVPRDEFRRALQEEKKDTYKACFDERCQIELGKAVAAEKSLGVQIVELGPKECAMTATLYDLKKEVVEKAATVKTGCARDTFSKTLDRVVQKLAGVEEDAAASGGVRPEVKSELKFQGGGEAPKVDLGQKVGGLDGMNLEAEQKYEAASEVQADEGAEPKDKLAAWCALAKVKGKNPYAKQAADACKSWQKYIADFAKLESRYKTDIVRINQYLDLKRPSPEQKVAAAGAFFEAYGAFYDREDYKNLALKMEPMQNEVACAQAAESCALGAHLEASKRLNVGAKMPPDLPVSHPAFGYNTGFGVSAGDPSARVKEVFGAPTEEKPRDTVQYLHFDVHNIRAWFHYDKLETLEIRADARPFLRARLKGQDAEKADLVGAGIAEVVKKLGEPAYYSNPAFIYPFEWGSLEFHCRVPYDRCDVVLRYRVIFRNGAPVFSAAHPAYALREFAGLRGGGSYSDTEAVLGAPNEKKPKDKIQYYHFGPGVTVWFNDDRIYEIDADVNGADLLRTRPRAMTDPNTKLVGATRAEVVKALGDPVNGNGDALVYPFVWGTATFTCPEKCSLKLEYSL